GPEAMPCPTPIPLSSRMGASSVGRCCAACFPESSAKSIDKQTNSKIKLNKSTFVSDYLAWLRRKLALDWLRPSCPTGECPMYAAERHQAILAQARAHGRVEVRDLAEL